MLGQFLGNIKNPPEEFTPVPFWFFNDQPDKGKIERQLADYVRKGVNGIVLHPRIGVPEEISYLSEEYFEVIKYVVQTAGRLGMKIVLYDEGMYPSGSAHGLVVAENADYASKGITLSDRAEGGQVITQFADGKYLVYGFTHGTIRGIHYGEDDGEAGAPKSADILNPEAVDAFIRLTHERYYQELKEYFGDTIIAFFTDEPCPLGRNAGGFREWAAGMEKEILAGNGKLEELEALFGGGENRTTRIYHKLVKKHLREIYYARLSGWCEAHGISLMGHPEASDDVEEEFYFHIPGQDLIMRRVSPETGGIREFDSVQAKLPADIARYLGRRRNANECFGVCNHRNIPWYFKGYDMKWYINWLGIRGVNLFVPHAFYYSVEGPRKGERPPDVGPHNIWWRHYRLFSDYIKRISYLMTDSVSLAKVAVLCDNNRVPAVETAGLYEHQIDFHYLPVAMLKDCAAREGRLCIGTCQFDVAVDLYGYREQEAYAEYLADVRVVGEAAALYPKNSCQKTFREDGQREMIRQAGSVGLEDCDYRTVVPESDCPSLRAVHMEKEGVSWYLFSNEGEETIETNVFIKELQDGRKPFLINLWDACAEDAVSCAGNSAGQPENGSSCIRLKLEHCEMKLLLLLDEDSVRIAETYRSESGSAKSAKSAFLGDWTDRFEQVSPQDAFASFGDISSPDADTNEDENTVICRYVCSVPQGQTFTGAEYFRICGEEMAECVCNGTFAGVSFYGPHTFRIGHLLKEGENEICLRFTGNAVNRYGDVKAPFGLPGKTSMCEIKLEWLVTSDSITVYFDKPENLPEEYKYQIFLNGKITGESDKTHFLIEGLNSSTYYDVQVKVSGNGKELAESLICHLHTNAAGNRLDVTKAPYGAAGDGNAMDTQAIQRAIDDCRTGDAVYFPAGIYKTGALRLHSNMELYLEEGATLQGTDNPEDYLPRIWSRFEGTELPCYSSLLNMGSLDHKSGPDCENILIRGKGTIASGGRILAERVIASETERLKDELAALGDQIREYEKPETIPGRVRPRLINISNCKNVRISGVTLKNGASWNVHMIYSDGIVTDHCRFYSEDVWNGDGWDPDSSSNCTIFGCVFYTGDDSVAVKSGKNPEGNEIGRPSRNIKIFDCRCAFGHGITIGSEMSGGVEDIKIWDCDMGDSLCGIEIKGTKKRGGYVRNVQVKDCRVSRLLFHSVGYNDDGIGAGVAPVFENCTFENVRITGKCLDHDGKYYETDCMELAGFDEPGHALKNILLKNITLGVAGEARRQTLVLSACEGITISNLKCL